MPDKRYRNAMDEVRFSEDFERRTLTKLKKEQTMKKKNRKPLWAGLGAAAVLALALAVGALPNLSRRDAVPAAEPTARPAEKAEPVQDTETEIETPVNATEAMDATADAMVSLSEEAYAPSLQARAVSTDEFSYVTENSWRDVLVSPLSTFAADVDTASYAALRRRILEGGEIPRDLVRIEEMLNYFSYDYPEPEGDAPFSITSQIAPCPWNSENYLLLVGLQAKRPDLTDRPRSNLVFLIDVSGSMDSPDRLPLAQKAFRLLIDSLDENDRVSIVTYAGEDSIALEGASGAQKQEITSAIDDLFAGGSTAGAAGIETAYQLAEKYFIEGGNNRVILATDGDMNVGVASESELTRLIEEKKKTGVYLSVLGFGQGNYKDNKLESLADYGNGNYAYIDSDLEAKKVLVEQLGGTFFTVLKDAKFQLEFNPDRVSSYRQIGYENRQMAAEDFADDAKDGGEIGAGHSVTLLYEIKLADGGARETPYKYQTTHSAGSDEFATVSVRAKEPDGEKSKLYTYPVSADRLSESMDETLNFASCVAETGLLLSGSPYQGSASYQNVLTRLHALKCTSNDPYKEEFTYLVSRLSRAQ